MSGLSPTCVQVRASWGRGGHGGHGGTVRARVGCRAMTPALEPPVPPCSRSQMGKLGKRLTSGDATEQDEALYGDVVVYFDALQSFVRDRIAAIPWRDVLNREHDLVATGRAKTRDTLLDKLRRTPQIQLGHIRDVAGVRVVGAMSIAEQDIVANRIAREFADHRIIGVVDRRATPSSGYRAVHVVMDVGGGYVEVQVRTLLQHLWAEVFERIADKLGREIRYGMLPENDLACEAVTQLQQVSINNIALVEAAHLGVVRRERERDAMRAQLDASPPDSPGREEAERTLRVVDEALERGRQVTLDLVSTMRNTLNQVLKVLEAWPEGTADWQGGVTQASPGGEES